MYNSVAARERDDVERDLGGDQHRDGDGHAGLQQGAAARRQVPPRAAATHDPHHRPHARR